MALFSKFYSYLFSNESLKLLGNTTKIWVAKIRATAIHLIVEKKENCSCITEKWMKWSWKENKPSRGTKACYLVFFSGQADTILVLSEKKAMVKPGMPFSLLQSSDSWMMLKSLAETKVWHLNTAAFCSPGAVLWFCFTIGIQNMDRPILDFTDISQSESPIICSCILASQHCKTIQLPNSKVHTRVNQNVSGCAVLVW